VKASTFILASGFYWLVCIFIAGSILLSCGLGPDSSEQCNIEADRNAIRFAVSALLFYGVVSIGVWRTSRRLRGKNVQ
jgi:hypothetical protein